MDYRLFLFYSRLYFGLRFFQPLLAGEGIILGNKTRPKRTEETGEGGLYPRDKINVATRKGPKISPYLAGKTGLSEEDCQKAKDLWLGYLKNMDSSSDRAFENANLWAAAVLISSGSNGDQGLNLSYLALALTFPTRISVKGKNCPNYKTRDKGFSSQSRKI